MRGEPGCAAGKTASRQRGAIPKIISTIPSSRSASLTMPTNRGSSGIATTNIGPM